MGVAALCKAPLEHITLIHATSPTTAPGGKGADDDKAPRPGIPNVTPLIVQQLSAGAYDSRVAAGMS